MANPKNDSSSLERDGAESVETVPLAEEHARVEKRIVPTGRVRIRTKVELVEELAQASLTEEFVEVTRVAINRYVDEAPQMRTDEGLTIVPVLEEVLVVEKRLLLKEEVHIRKQVRTEEVTVPVQLRKQRASIERTSPEEAEW